MPSFKQACGFASLAIVLCGCTTLPVPMVPRVDDETQGKVTAAWTAMLSPVNRLDRQTLLDAIINYQFHEMGVERFSARVEKTFDGGTVVMEIQFDRARPAADRFVVEVFDKGWRLIRRESYSREDVENTVRALSLPDVQTVEASGGQAPLDEEARKRLDEARRRRERLEAILRPNHEK
jgi:sulfite reductase beta subunit-like hemoprotein